MKTDIFKISELVSKKENDDEDKVDSPPAPDGKFCKSDSTVWPDAFQKQRILKLPC